MITLSLILSILAHVWNVSANSIIATMIPPSPTAYFSSNLIVACSSGSTAMISKISSDPEVNVIGALNSSLNSSTSSANFSIYFTSPGLITLNVSCEAFSLQLNLTILSEVLLLDTLSYVIFT